MTHSCPFCLNPLPKDIQNSALIFLDINGVLASPNESSLNLKEEAVNQLQMAIQHIERTYPVYIIISSNWRNKGSVEKLRDSIFGAYQFSKKIIGKTPSSYLGGREKEILNWLEAHFLTESRYVIIDDMKGWSDQISEKVAIIEGGWLKEKHIPLILKPLLG